MKVCPVLVVIGLCPCLGGVCPHWAGCVGSWSGAFGQNLVAKIAMQELKCALHEYIPRWPSS